MSLDFKSRLRQASFMAPSATEQIFQTDTVVRRGGKKIATVEIIDSDESVSQDFGNKTDVFPVSAYFIGDDFDTQVTDFEKLLKERYTQDSPGYLRHPLWGDIDVFPVSWEISIELVQGVGVGKIECEFVQVFPKKYPESALDSADIASANLDDMSALDIANNIITSTAAAIKNVRDKIEAVVSVIETATEALETIEDTALAIQSEIDGLIDDVGGNITQLLFATQRLMKLPGQIVDNTMSKINAYREMITDIIDAIRGTSGGTGWAGSVDVINPDNRKNNAVLMQAFAGFAVGCLAETAIYTEFSDRTKSVEAIQILDSAMDDYNVAMGEIKSSGNYLTNEFSGDYNFDSLLFDVRARVQELLLNKTFDLKAEKRFTLKNASDILTLCYQYYGNVDDSTIDYFIDTNKIKHDEFDELPRGWQGVIYV